MGLIRPSEDQISRRRLLKMTGATGVGLALVAVVGCGDDDDGGTSATQTSGPSGSSAATPTQNPSEPVSGGTWSGYITADPDSIDPNIDYGGGRSLMSHVYSRLFRFEAGPDVDPGGLSVTPDVAEDFDVSPDGLVYTITLRDNVFFHPPLDRALTAEDVVFSFDRFFGEAGGVEPSANVGRLGAIETVEATGPLEVTITLNAPASNLPILLADADLIVVLPVEAADEIDLTQTMVGTGALVLEDYRPGTGATYTRHAKWHHGPDLPYLDGVEVSVVTEAATRVNQFLGGNLDVTDAQGDDAIRIHREAPDAQLFQVPPTGLSMINFQGADKTKPWADERVRQAVSVAIDRDALLDAAYSVNSLEQEGLPVERVWHTHIPAGFKTYWLDPQKEMDPSVARYFQYDPDLARSLLAEAGYADGFSAPLNATREAYGRAYDIMAELIVQYLAEVGINLDLTIHDYTSVFVPTVAVKGEFDGLLFIPLNRVDPGDFLVTEFASTSGRNTYKPEDAELDRRLTEMREAPSLEARVDIIRDFQDYLAGKMYNVPMVFGAGPGYLAYQPNTGNVLDYQVIGQTQYPADALPYYYKTA